MTTPDPVQGLDVLPEYTDPPAIPDHLTAIWNALMSRAVPRFASDAQRDFGIPAPVDGMLAWVDDGVTETLYLRATGAGPSSGWRQIWPAHGSYGRPWNTYSPTLGSGWVIGNGTLEAYWESVGKTVDFRIEFTLGSTSQVGSGAMTLPVGRRGGSSSGLITIGQFFCFDASTNARRLGDVYVGSGVGASMAFALNDGNSLGPTSPFTWATGDRFTVTGRFEAN